MFDFFRIFFSRVLCENGELSASLNHFTRVLIWGTRLIVCVFLEQKQYF